MPLLTLYFQLHQPFRLHPDGAALLWDEKNREIFTQQSRTVLSAHDPHVLGPRACPLRLQDQPRHVRDLPGAGRNLPARGHRRSERTAQRRPETPGRSSSWSSPTTTPRLLLRRPAQDRVQGAGLAAPPEDARRLRRQADAPSPIPPCRYSNEVANIVADMGFKAILCEPSDKTINVRDHAAHPTPTGSIAPSGERPAAQAGRAAPKHGSQPQARLHWAPNGDCLPGRGSTPT